MRQLTKRHQQFSKNIKWYKSEISQHKMDNISVRFWNHLEKKNRILRFLQFLIFAFLRFLHFFDLEEPCIFHFLVGLAFHVHKITPYITKISRSPKRTHHSQIDNSAQALQEFLVVSLWHKNFQVPLLCRFLRCYLVCYLSVIFRTWGKISRLDNAIDNAQKIHPVMALGKFSTTKSQQKTTVKPATNCRFASGACV